LECWIESVLPHAIAFAYSLLRDRVLAEDIVQDCICRLLRHAQTYDLPRDGRKLLFRAITNASINHKTRTKEIVSLDDFGRFGGDGPWELEDQRTSAPPDLAMRKELHSAVGEGLAGLPLRERTALELASLGYKPMEIAEMLEVSPQNLRVILCRARKTLASFLNKRFADRIVR
jgi:RNA polymerase sigma-70 factor (ECF subfamily)